MKEGGKALNNSVHYHPGSIGTTIHHLPCRLTHHITSPHLKTPSLLLHLEASFPSLVSLHRPTWTHLLTHLATVARVVNYPHPCTMCIFLVAFSLSLTDGWIGSILFGAWFGRPRCPAGTKGTRNLRPFKSAWWESGEEFPLHMNRELLTDMKVPEGLALPSARNVVLAWR